MKKEVISIETYYQAMIELLTTINCQFDCIVAMKRSGWIMGTFFSNVTSKPVFTISEIESLPAKYKNILIVDDKICKGKSIRKVANKLTRKGKTSRSACLFVQGKVYPDYYVKSIGSIVTMWYENKIIQKKQKNNESRRNKG